MRTFRVAALLMTTVVSLAIAEAGVRVLDGYAPLSLSLRRTREYEPSGTPDRRYLPASLAAGVKPDWYELDPPEVPRFPVTAEIAAREKRYPDRIYDAFFVWNSVYARETICRAPHADPFAPLDDFYTFDPPDGSMFPLYRHFPHVNPRGWFTPNNFGWRGPDITAHRSATTIRIAFVGASTTVDAYGYKFSHPELVGYWLNLWARNVGLPYTIEAINTGRTGVDSSTLAAVVRDELASVDPDLVVFYEGANSFSPVAALDAPKTLPARPSVTFRKRSPAEGYSAIAVRAYDAMLKTGQDGSEPAKPAYHVVWPSDVDEQNPDLGRDLPMHLERVVANLDVMHGALAAAGGELALASFVWLVYPGMRLDMTRNLTLFRYLNDSYWPATYEQMRRLMDFQNRVFRTYAHRRALVYLPMDEMYPRDPDLFGDAVHMTARGLRLRAWLYLQQLIPIVQARIAAHKWPRPPSAKAPSADWAKTPPKLVSRAAILASCPAAVQ